jgi:PncC family amidohydrolase
MATEAGREAEESRLSTSGATLTALASGLQAAALARGLTVSTAESCTGGLIGHSLTAIAGSSDYYLGGVISYSNELKMRLLGVPRRALDHHGAVSAQVAVAMAEGARELTGADFAVSVTGVAGPGGGTEAKPVGLTYVAVARAGGHEVRRHQWMGDRAANKELSAAAALELLLELVEGLGR